MLGLREEERAVKIVRADVVLTWDNGRRVRIGSVPGKKKRDVLHVTQALGWELVRKGFRMMLPGCEWKEDYGSEPEESRDRRE